MLSKCNDVQVGYLEIIYNICVLNNCTVIPTKVVTQSLHMMNILYYKLYGYSYTTYMECLIEVMIKHHTQAQLDETAFKYTLVKVSLQSVILSSF